jgi:CRP-like cAMP-binding protein
MEKNINFPQTSIFAHLDLHETQALERDAEVRHYPAGNWITQYEDVWPFFFFIKSGRVTAVKESFEGRSLMLTTFNAGEVFWGLAFFIQDAPMPASLRAMQETEILLWPRERLLPLLLRDGRLAWELSCLVIQRVQFASEMVEKLAFHPVAGRLANLLLEQTGKNNTVTLPRDLTLDEMAARIGSTREVVCRFLYRFSDSGLININRTEFIISDRAGLSDLARKGK